jgi:hypothetical protein
VDNLLEMRQNLNWVTEIPRHGPDCRKDMEILRDKPLTEKVQKTAAGFGIFNLVRHVMH